MAGEDRRIEGGPKTTMQKLVGLEQRFDTLEDQELEDTRDELQLIQTQLADLETETKKTFPNEKSGGTIVFQRIGELRKKVKTKLGSVE